MVTGSLVRLRELDIPEAQRLQGDVTVLDFALTLALQQARPRVRWWWARREANGISKALCHGCDLYIAGWSGTTRITTAAQTAIIEHRDAVHAPRSTHPGNDAAGTMPAAVSNGQEAEQ